MVEGMLADAICQLADMVGVDEIAADLRAADVAFWHIVTGTRRTLSDQSDGRQDAGWRTAGPSFTFADITAGGPERGALSLDVLSGSAAAALAAPNQATPIGNEVGIRNQRLLVVQVPMC